jgi:two-component system, NarL family, nitrate/nitrite response regulator NarL
MSDELTNREKQAARLAASGISNREVGQKMGLKVGTIEQYLNRAYDKLGVKDRTELTYRAESLK